MTDYELEYRKGRGVCGEPFPEFVAFFAEYPGRNSTVLDLGCGQGRDALFIARLGHHVRGIDVSETGIAQMLDDAKAEGLAVQGQVADVTDYTPESSFDVVIIDRVLHMLKQPEQRDSLLAKARHHTNPDGYILVADVPSNRELIVGAFREAPKWEVVDSTKNFTFAHHVGE